jgi:hypothetical protein
MLVIGIGNHDKDQVDTKGHDDNFERPALLDGDDY